MFFVVVVFGIAQFDCGPLPPPLNGRILIEDGNTSHIILCDLGFLLIGKEYRHCDLSRNWPGSQPICEGMAINVIRPK